MTFHNAAAHRALALMGLQLELPEDTHLRELRAVIGIRVDALIAFLDATEPDPDLEDLGDAEPDMESEPCLGWSENVGQLRLTATEDGDTTWLEQQGGDGFMRCGSDDHEEDDPSGEGGYGVDSVDVEATLGWPEDFTALVSLDGRSSEWSGEAEPSLGAIEGDHLHGWSRPTGHVLDEDGEDSATLPGASGL
jgi:hypothetical protein